MENGKEKRWREMQAGVLPWPTLRYLSLPSDCATGCGGRGCKRWNGPISKRLAN